MEELRQQLGDRLPKVIKLAADSMGMEQKAFEKAVEMRQIDSIEFIRNFTKAFDAFADPAYRAAMDKTFFRFNLLRNEFDSFVTAVFKAGLDKILGTTFDSLRHSLEVIKSLLVPIVRWLSMGFQIATLPLRLFIATIADLLEHFGLLEDLTGNFEIVNWIMGGVVAAVMLVAQFKMVAWLLGKSLKSLKEIGRLKNLLAGSLAEQCGCSGADVDVDKDGKKDPKDKKKSRVKDFFKNMSGKAKALVGIIVTGAIAGLARSKDLVGKTLPIVGKGIKGLGGLGPTLMLQSFNAGEGSDNPEEYFRQKQMAIANILGLPETEETLNALKNYRTMGPSAVMQPETKVNVSVTVGLDEGEMSKVLKVKSQEEDMEVLGNIAR